MRPLGGNVCDQITRCFFPYLHHNSVSPTLSFSLLISPFSNFLPSMSSHLLSFITSQPASPYFSKLTALVLFLLLTSTPCCPLQSLINQYPLVSIFLHLKAACVTEETCSLKNKLFWNCIHLPHAWSCKNKKFSLIYCATTFDWLNCQILSDIETALCGIRSTCK